MANGSEPLLNVVTVNKPKVLCPPEGGRLDQKGDVARRRGWNATPAADIAPPAKRRGLTHRITCVERGKPVVLPALAGKANRKASPWDGGYGIAEEAKAAL